MPALQLLPEQAAAVFRVERISGAGDTAGEACALLDEGRRIDGGIGARPRQHRHHVGLGWRHGRIAGRRHDRRQGRDARRMLARQDLRDHAAHRPSHDMGTPDGQHVQKGERVVRHVVERIGDLDTLSGHETRHELPEIDRAVLGEMAGLAAVPIVEADDAVAPRRQRPAEGGGPADHLCSEARHEEDRVRRLGAEALIGQGDGRGACIPDMNAVSSHQRRSAPRSAA